MKKPLPFSVFKRANRPSYLVAFKNEKTGTYLPPISTQQTDEAAAIKTAYDLLDPVIYRELQNLFIEAYQAIPKFGWQCNIENQEKVTPKMFNELLAEQYRQTFPKEYMHLLKVLKESESLNIIINNNVINNSTEIRFRGTKKDFEDKVIRSLSTYDKNGQIQFSNKPGSKLDELY
jgi:hypothetical protein